MKTKLIVLIILAWFTAGSAENASPAGDSSGPRQPSVAVFTASGVKHAPSRQRVASTLSWAAAELGVPDRELPNVAVFYINRETANVMQIDAANEVAIVSATNDHDAMRTVYQAWVVNGTSDTATALAMIQVLNVRFGLQLKEEKIASATIRVRKKLEQQVDILSLH